VIFRILLGYDFSTVSLIEDSGCPPSFRIPGSDIGRMAFTWGFRF
jgi:hypothetical protein